MDYGEKRRAFARKAASRNLLRKHQSDSPFLVVTKTAALHTPRPPQRNPARKPSSNNRPTQIRRATYTARIA
jgi:hypothetical protein